MRNPVDTIAIFEPPKLEQTLSTIGRAENIDAVLYHTNIGWGGWRRSSAMFAGVDPAQFIEMMLQQMLRAREAAGKPLVVVLRQPLDAEAMERTMDFQERCWRAGFPVFPTIPRAANAIAKLLAWRSGRP